ncbi:MAG: hypothetical protein DRQ88_04075 [Epsilonproteobacteria bacterium]|nr:MAG: hypothetical protein DRQ89_00650 [Campylobacterota bacterium]RLA67079.1 MAG: hypothetical protein DRQ88_04075 [Campylobacterota bacterium]
MLILLLISSGAHSGVITDLNKAFTKTFIDKIDGTLKIKIFRRIPSAWAFATKKENNYTITVFGGYFNNPNITFDSLSLLLCHELGHILGGSPKRHDDEGNLTWSSVEGQADFFAPKCLINFLKTNPEFDGTEVFLDSTPIPENLLLECESTYNRGLCLRFFKASIDLIKVFRYNEHHKDESLPSFNTPDPTVVNTLWEKHPNLQCRLDTYVAAILDRPRPKCWFFYKRYHGID